MDYEGLFDDDERLPRTPREERIARAREKEHVRLALGSTSRFGYYVFDEVITQNSGIADFLAVGPIGVIVIVLSFYSGHVSRGSSEGRILIDGDSPRDDPLLAGRELRDEIDRKVFDDLGAMGSIVCFPRCTLELDEKRKPPLGTTPVWELPWALDPEGEEEELTPADIEEIAERIQEIYGRPPIVTPRTDEEWEGGT